MLSDVAAHPSDVPSAVPRSATPSPTAVGPLLVLGVAGTGKTRTSSRRRFRWLVEGGCAPSGSRSWRRSAARADAIARPARASARGVATTSCSSLTPVELAARDPAARAGVDARADARRRPSGSRCCSSGSIELSLEHHDFGGSANALLGGFIRRIDRLKAELIGAEDYARGPPARLTARSRRTCAARARVRRGLPSARADAGRGRARATPATSIRDALRVVARPPAWRAVRARARRRRAGARPRRRRP